MNSGLIIIPKSGTESSALVKDALLKAITEAKTLIDALFQGKKPLSCLFLQFRCWFQKWVFLEIGYSDILGC